MEGLGNNSTTEYIDDASDPANFEKASAPEIIDSAKGELAHGAEVYQNAIGEVPDNLPTEALLLFSKFESTGESGDYGQTKVTMFGLETPNGKFSFTKEGQKTVHLAILEELSHGVDNHEELTEKIASVDMTLSSNLISVEQDRLIKERREKLNGQIRAMRAEDAKPFKKNDRRNFAIRRIADHYGLDHVQSIEVYNDLCWYNNNRESSGDKPKDTERKANARAEIEQKLLDTYHIEEIIELNDVEKERRRLFDEFIIQDGYMTEPELEEYKNAFIDERKTISKQLTAFLGVTKKDAVFKKLDWIKSLVAEESKDKWLQANPEEKLKDTYSTAFSSKLISDKKRLGEPIPSIEEIKHTLKETYFANKEELFDEIVTNWESISRRYYEDLVPKHRKAEIIWGSTPAELYNKTTKKIDLIKQDFHKFKTDESYKIAEKNIASLKENVAGKISNKNYSKVFWLPTGFIAEDQGKFSTRVISPLDPAIQKNIPKNMQDSWREAWSNNERFVNNFSKPVYRSLNQELRDSLDIQDMKPHEQHLQELSKQYDFDLPPIVNEYTGEINPQISEENIPVLDEIIQPLSNYINKVSFEEPIRGYQDLDTIQKQILNYLNGTSQSPLCSLYSSIAGEKTLNLAELSHLTNSSNLSPLSLCSIVIGLNTYYNLPQESQKEYQTLYPTQKLSIPETTFNKLFKRRVPSALERRKLLARSLFVADFKKYINKRPLPPEIQDFFSTHM